MRNSEDRRLKLYRGTWCVVWRENGTTKRASLRTKDRGQAERNFQEYLRQTAHSGETVSDILDLWFVEKSNLKSIEIAKAKAKPIKKFFGNLYPDQITKPLCRDYAKFRKVSNTTIRNELAILRCAVKWNNPHTKALFELPAADPPKSRHITKEQYKTLLESAVSLHMRLFIILAIGTAARSNALLSLTWDRIDFDRGLVNLASGDHKNKKRALVPMTKNVRAALEEAYEARTCDYVIEFGGRGVKSIAAGFRATAKRAGIEVTPHMLRHSAAVWMVEDRVPIEEVAQYLGHTNTAITYSVYARYSPDYLRRAAESLDV